MKNKEYDKISYKDDLNQWRAVVEVSEGLHSVDRGATLGGEGASSYECFTWKEALQVSSSGDVNRRTLANNGCLDIRTITVCMSAADIANY